MFFKEEGNIRKEKVKIQKLSTFMLLFTLVFIFTKIEVFSPEFGIILIISMYIFINFSMTNLFFSSKRTTFKIYIFILLDIIYFLLGVFSIKSIFFFFFFLFLLSYLIMKDEGKMEVPKIANFMILYILFRILFTISLVFI